MAPSPVRSIEREVQAAARYARNGLHYVAGGPADIEPTPYDVIWTRHKAQLRRYRGAVRKSDAPVLIVPSLVGRSYIFDLHPGNSAISVLLASGLDVFMLDFGIPDGADAQNTLETYAWGYVPEAAAATCALTGSDELTLIGYCFGGIISLVALAGPTTLPARRLVTMATPVDFGRMKVLAAFARTGRLEPAELTDETGNVPAERIKSLFPLVRPTSGLAQKASLLQHLGNDAYVAGFRAMNQWVHDHVPLPGGVSEQIVELLVRDNALISGTLRLAGHDSDLRSITCPYLNVVALNDTLVPPAAALPAIDLVGSLKRDQLTLPAGHVSLFSGRTAAKMALPGIIEWIEQGRAPARAR